MFLNIGILDLGVGNLKSIFQVFEKLPLNFNINLIKNSKNIYNIDKLIVPGQGSSYTYLNYLKKFDLYNFFINCCNNKKLMGICVGKHIFFEKSEENIKLNNFCLLIFIGFIKKFFFKKNFLFKIPNINWNKVKILNNHILLKNIYDLKNFYFSHSFYLNSSSLEFIYGVTSYNINFSTIFIKNNIFLVQFHPEKSFLLGLKLFYNFFIW